MLSRSASTSTRSNLRRTKSAASIPTNRHLSIAPVIDPKTAQQHALVAATVAFERSHDRQGAANISTNNNATDQQQLRRRRSHRASGFEGEGSHFAEPRTPRRQSSKGKGVGRSAKSEDTADSDLRKGRSGVRSAEDAASDVAARDFVVRHTLSRMPSVRTIREDDRFKQHRSSISVHKLRKAKSMYSTSSQVGDIGGIDDISSAPPQYAPPLPPLPAPLEQTITSISELAVEESVDITTTNVPAPLTRVNLDHVPDRPFEFGPPAAKELTTQSLRHRASMMFTPFKKRKDLATPTKPPPGSSGISTPTYSNIVRPPGPVAHGTPRFEHKRISSEVKKGGSIKAKIRSVFRRTSNPNPLQELPVQQVNASRAYFGQASSFGARNKENVAVASSSPGPSKENAMHTLLQPPTVLDRGPSPSHSVVSNGMKSRVTSWADSTIAGTIVEVDEEQTLDIASTHDGEADSSHKKDTKFSSLNLLKKLRRVSKVEMNKPPVEPRAEDSGSRQSKRSSLLPSRKTSGARDSLPSQIRKTTTFNQSSIRAVSMESEHQNLNVPARSSESPSPDPTSSEHSVHSTFRGCNKIRKPSPLAMAALPPSPDQIAARVRRSEERWQEPLDSGRSLFFPRSPMRASAERHSRKSSSQHGEVVGLEPESDDVFLDAPLPPTRAADVISPSVYSQDGICRNLDVVAELSPLPPTPMLPEPGTAVVLNNHHVARYSVGSPKKAEVMEPRKASKEWRNWLESEVRELETPPPEDLQLKPEFIPRNPNSGHHKERAQINDSDTDSGDEVEDNEASSKEVVATATPVVHRKAAPAMIWRPTQPPRIIQHTSESSIPSTTTSAHSLDRGSSSSRSRKISHRFAADSERPSSRLHDIDESSISDKRPSSRMNDRFPYIPSSRPQSRASGHSSTTPAQSLHSRSSRPTMVQKIQAAPAVVTAAERNKENSAPSQHTALPTPPPLPLTRPRLGLRRPMSTTAIGGRAQSTLATYTINEPHVSPNASLPLTPQPQPSLLPRPVAQSSPATRRTTSSLAVTPDVTVRKLKHISMPSLETDPTLAGILQGPYRSSASPRPLSIRKATSFHNSPSRTSSTSPLKEKKPSPSTPRTNAEAVEGGKATPTSGQRLAEQFLNARRLRESIRVGSPGEGSPVSANGSSSRSVAERVELSLADFSPAFL